MAEITSRIVFDTSALMDLFGEWTDTRLPHRGEVVKEIQLLAPLKPYLFSSRAIREEAREHMNIGSELDHYITFERIDDHELEPVKGFVSTREADFSLITLCLRFEREGSRTFLITKDRTFVADLPGAGSRAVLVPPDGFAEAITALTPQTSRNLKLAYSVQDNTFINMSRAMRFVKHTQGEAAYNDWQAFLDGQAASKHELIEALKATGIRLG
jgi:hypothetical protein